MTEIGSEPEILAERSEEIEEIPPPEQGLSEDLKELLETAPTGAEPSSEEPSPEVEGIAEEMPSEAELPIDESLPEAEQPADLGTEEALPSELPDLDFESLFGDQEGEEGGLGEGLDQLPDEFQEAEQEAGEPEESAPLAAEPLAGEPEETEAAGPPSPAEAEEFPEEIEPPETPMEEGLPEDFELPEMAPMEEEAGEEAVPEEGLPELVMETAEEAAADAAAGVPEADVPIAAVEEVTAAEPEAGAPEEALMEAPAGAPEEEAEFPELPEDAAQPAEEELFQPPEELLEGLDVEPMEAPPGELEEAPTEAPAGAPAVAAPEEGVPEEEEILLSDELEEMQGFELGPEEQPEEDFQLDDFTLPGMEGEEAEEAPFEVPPGAEEEPIPGEPEAGFIAEEGIPLAEIALPGEIEEPGEEIPEVEAEYTDDEFDAVKQSLASLPLNLKMVIEELIGENQLSVEDQRQLLDVLIAGGSPSEIAELTSRLSGREIRLPKRFEKRTGIAFERERRTFAYAFRENIVPILRVFIPAAIVVFILSMAVNRYIIQPLRANGLYTQGYNLIPQDRFGEAEERFETAFALNAVKGWFYKYAERYSEQNQISRAEQKYEDLLLRYRNDKKGMLDYAKLETEQTKFPKSEELLRKILDQDALDYDALLASGDNYLEWAKRDERYYDNARDAYVRILRGKDGARDEPWLHMLRYHMRTDNLAEVERIKSMFESDKRKKIDPVIYTELGGYLIGRGKLDDVKSILNRSMKAKRDLPETYYNFSRFFKETGDSVKEREALSFTLHYLNEAHSTPERLAVRINTHNRIGEIHYEGGEHLNAEKEFQKAMKLIRDGAERKLLPQDPAFGQVFYNSGDIHYYVHRNLDVSEALYKEARNYGFENTELNYKLGYINYVGEDYGNALLEFYQIASQYRNNRNLLYSIANTLYNRNDFFAAQGYYNRLLDHLEDQQSKIPLLRPQEDAQHRSLIEILMKTHNNLGVTLKKLSESPRNPEKETQSLVSLTRSSQFFDVLSRDPETLSRGQTKNLAYLNTRGILYPQADFIPQIYRRIPKDSAAAHF